jgi:hypothetical protein
MEDEVLYCLPFYALLFAPLIRRQLRDIFIYLPSGLRNGHSGRQKPLIALERVTYASG